MRNRTVLAVLGSFALLAGLAAPAAAQKVVKIGDLGSKVGVFEGYGKYQTMAIQLAVDEVNAKGGVLGHKIEIISEDDETKPAPAVRKAEKLILQDDVKLLIGAVSSGATMAVMDVTKKHKVIHWNSVSCAEFMRTTKFHKYYFSNQPDSRMQANGLAKYIVDKMGKRVYIFYTDYAMGQSDGRQFKTALEKVGGEVVGVAGAPLDTKDFSPWFGAINQTSPDVLFVAFAGTDSLRLMTQLHSFGMTKKYKLAGIDCFLLQQDLPAIAEPMEGFVQLAHYSAYNPDPNMQAFNAKFKKKFGVDANIMAGAYDAVLFWAAAVEKAKSFDSDKVAEAQEGMCLENTHIGRQCIRKEDHQVVMDMHLYQVKGGKNLPIAVLQGKDTIGEPMVGKDPVEGFTWDIKKKNSALEYLSAVLLPQLLHGVVFGAALGLLALGLTVIFGLLGVMNFAHGELYMFGAYAGIVVIGLTNSFWVALVAAPLLVAVLGAVTEVATLRPLYRREPLYGLIITFGLALIFREGARQLFGGDMRRILPPIEGSIPLLGMTYPKYRLFLLAASSVLLLAIWLFFTRTRAGIIVRAAVQDAEMLDGLGVNVPRVFTLTFAGSAALAALAGLLLAPVFTVYPQMGVEMILLAFIVVILGGMGSLGGSVVAAFVIGIAQSLLTLWMNPQRVAIAIFGIMIVVLIVRPRGFFGREGVLE